MSIGGAVRGMTDCTPSVKPAASRRSRSRCEAARICSGLQSERCASSWESRSVCRAACATFGHRRLVGHDEAVLEARRLLDQHVLQVASKALDELLLGLALARRDELTRTVMKTDDTRW